MKRADLIDKLERMTASDLAAIAGVALKRGRPSSALRESLIDAVVTAIIEKRAYVRSDGSIVRR